MMCCWAGWSYSNGISGQSETIHLAASSVLRGSEPDTAFAETALRVLSENSAEHCGGRADDYPNELSLEILVYC
jgi:hypothetical protein